MRKITQQAQAAFDANTPFKSGNTQVTISDDITRLVLHGHVIANKHHKTGRKAFSMCGWGSNTTRERLHAAGISISQSKNEQLYNHPNTGERIIINSYDKYLIQNNGDIVKDDR